MPPTRPPPLPHSCYSSITEALQGSSGITVIQQHYSDAKAAEGATASYKYRSVPAPTKRLFSGIVEAEHPSSSTVATQASHGRIAAALQRQSGASEAPQ